MVKDHKNLGRSPHHGKNLSSLLENVSPPMIEGLAKGVLPWYIMHLLNERPLYGYDIIRLIAEMTRGAWKPSPGSVYPLLHNFEGDGLITGDWERGRAAPKRRYRITNKGKATVPEMRRELVRRLSTAKELIEHHIQFLSQGLDEEDE